MADSHAAKLEAWIAQMQAMADTLSNRQLLHRPATCGPCADAITQRRDPHPRRTCRAWTIPRCLAWTRQRPRGAVAAPSRRGCEGARSDHEPAPTGAVNCNRVRAR